MKTIITAIVICISSFMEISAQNGSIQGRVISSDLQPIQLVNISLMGTTKGTVTDLDGQFAISNLKPGNYTIVASAIGLTRQQQQVQVSADEVTEVNFMINESMVSLSEVVVSESKINPYNKDSSFIVAKLPLTALENPQVYNTVTAQLMKDQVVTNINDALKNATGVSRLWESTGRGGDGAEYYAMRGFAVQPTMVNGMPSVNNGGLDPANVASIDVIKGPSGTLFGSPMISYGGLINISTKQAYETFGGEIGIVSGSNALNRVTADVNVPLNSSISARFNSAYHSENSFQDAGFTKSFFIAPSFTIKSSERLTFVINTEFLQKESAIAPMVFLNRNAPLTFSSMDPFEANYKNSYTSNVLTIKNPSFGLQAQALYRLSDSWTSQTVLSRSNTKTNGYYQYLWDFSDGDTFGRYISNRNGGTNTMDLQQNFIGDFNIGRLRNRMIVGLDYFKSNILNSSSGWVLNGQVTLSDGNDTGDLTRAGVDDLLIGSFEGNSTATSETMSAYISDVINFSPSLSAMASVRFDRFEGKTAYWSDQEIKSQTNISPKFGIVYQPVKGVVSVFANYMNGFVNVAPSQVTEADGSNPRLKSFDPENANQYEVGLKTNLYKDRISATVSYYDIMVKTG